MTYYVKAYKGAKSINLQVEEKHNYYHTSDTQFYQLQLPQISPTIAGSGTKLTQYQIQVLFYTNQIKFVEGTGNDEMIGSKVHIKSAGYSGWISLYPDTLIADFPHGTLTDLRFNFRLMVVKFDSDLPHSDRLSISQWFNNNYIYYDSLTESNSTNIRKLRESTKDTGKFKILMDESFTLTNKHTNQMINFTIPGFFGNCNTKQTGATSEIGTITNEDLRDIVCFIIGPVNPYIDMDAVSTDKWVDAAKNETIAIGNGNMKISYYDI